MTPHPELTAAIDAARSAPDDTDAWKRLGMAIAAHGTPAMLDGTFGQRQIHRGDGVDLLFSALFNEELARNDALRDRIVTFATHGQDNAMGTVMRFFAGCLQLCHGDAQAGVAAFSQAAAYIERHPVAFEGTQHLIKAPAFARMILTPDDVEQRYTTGARLDIPEPVFVNGPVPVEASRWVYASCDSCYFAAFANRFMAVASALGPIHIHVVNPTPEQLALMAGLASAERQFSHETRDLYSTSPYFASNRFFHVVRMMDRYAADLLMLDIDLDGLTNIDAALAAMKNADIGYFAMPTVMPWLRHHAAFIWLRNSPGTRLFQDRFSRLLQTMLPGGTWFVDQVCFLNLINACPAHRYPLQIVGLEAADGYPFASFVTPAGEDDSKACMRMQAGLSGAP